ncbi:translation initiation factor 2 [Thiolapillus sp.]
MSTNSEAKPDKISDEQLLRASRSFEAMMLSQIDISAKLANDLKHAIRIGMAVLALIAISILVLLLTLSSQINRISDVVLDMNTNFSSVTVRMDHMSQYIDSMAKRVALLQLMDEQTAGMKQEIATINDSMASMRETIGSMSAKVTNVRQSVDGMSVSISRMDDQVQLMAADMQYMAKPARSINKMFPLP